MIRPPSGSRPDCLRAYLCLIVFFAAFALPRAAVANGSDLPPEVVLQGFLKPEGGRLVLLVRVPLVLLSSFSLPKRGAGYLDLPRIDDALNRAAIATGRQIELVEDGVTLVPAVRAARISFLSDRSFESYASAIAHFGSPPLAADIDLFWNQGFFDVQLEYPIRSPDAHFSIHMNVAPELGKRVKLHLEFLPAGGPPRVYEIPGGSGWISLAPQWYEAVWLFLKVGFIDAFGIDRFVFFVCVAAPFRRFRSLLAAVVVFTGLQALTLTAAAEGTVADIRWLPAIFDTALAAAIVLLAVGNLASPDLRRRWFIAAVVGALGGFGLGHLLADALQFAGAHRLVSVVSYNVGVALGEVVMLLLALAALRLLFFVLKPPLGVVVLSAVLGHEAWHWMKDAAHEFEHQLGHAAAGGLSSDLRVVGLWLLPALIVGGIAYFLPQRFNGTPMPSLLSALDDRFR